MPRCFGGRWQSPLGSIFAHCSAWWTNPATSREEIYADTITRDYSLDDPFERSDRKWSLRAVELAGKASADVGAFGDRLRTLEIDIDDLRQTVRR
jgi:hypothetical protein